MKPITIPLSEFQRRRMQQIGAEIEQLKRVQSEICSAIIGGVKDPAALAGWDVSIGEREIVCTPPASSGQSDVA